MVATPSGPRTKCKKRYRYLKQHGRDATHHLEHVPEVRDAVEVESLGGLLRVSHDAEGELGVEAAGRYGVSRLKVQPHLFGDTEGVHEWTGGQTRTEALTQERGVVQGQEVGGAESRWGWRSAEVGRVSRTKTAKAVPQGATRRSLDSRRKKGPRSHANTRTGMRRQETEAGSAAAQHVERKHR